MTNIFELSILLLVFIRLKKTSDARIKISALKRKGSPWRTPFCNLKYALAVRALITHDS